METTIHFRRGTVRYTPAGLTLARPGGGWTVGAPRLRGVAVRRVRFALWYMLGGLLTAYCLIGIVGNSLDPLPAWGGLLAGGLLLAVGLRGAWQLSAHLHDEPDARTEWLYGADEGALLRFANAVNDHLRSAEEARRLSALAEAEAARQAAAQAGFGPTTAVGGASITFLLPPGSPAQPVEPPAPPRPPDPYPPSLLPGILP